MATGTQANPVTAEIIRGALVATTDEMKSCLLRTAYSQIIYEGFDFTVGLFDADGETISIGLGLPMFIHGLAASVKAKIARYSEEGLVEGDMLVTNDAYLTGSHLNHMVVTLPIFHDGEVIAYASTMAHWQDIGGTLGIITKDIYSEGLQIPIMKLESAGCPNSDLLQIISSNVRFPAMALGDLRGQIGAVRTGAERVRAIVSRYGPDAFRGAIESLYEQTERIARGVVTAIPDGTYTASSFMDNDGVTEDRIPINVKVIVAGDELTIDLSGVGHQVAGYFNSGATTGIGAARVAFRCITTADVFPINDGAYRALTVVLPPGRVVSAVKPASMHRWMTIPMTIIDTVFRALSEVVPERVIAGHHADLCSRTLYGIDYRTGKFFLRNGGPIGGGWGAKYNSDGESGTICINDGDTHGAPIEALERKLPVLVERYGFRTDSGGAGEFRGGLGVEQRMRFLSPVTNMDTGIDRTQCAPWGLKGGHAGLPNRVRFIRNDGPSNPPGGKFAGLTFAKGETFIVESGGGGGYGDPLERDAEAVRRDVAAEYVSASTASDIYGVVLDSSGKIDDVATKARRAELRSRRPAGARQ
jgi:N-methylhydantoinase B